MKFNKKKCEKIQFSKFTILCTYNANEQLVLRENQKHILIIRNLYLLNDESVHDSTSMYADSVQLGKTEQID